MAHQTKKYLNSNRMWVPVYTCFYCDEPAIVINIHVIEWCHANKYHHHEELCVCYKHESILKELNYDFVIDDWDRTWCAESEIEYVRDYTGEHAVV